MKLRPSLMLLSVLVMGAAAPPASSSTAAQAQSMAPRPEDVAESAGAPLIGKYAPSITLRTLDGKTIDLATLYGKKPVYLKFWATWCVPCREQMPHFENVERTLGKDIEVVAVDAGFNETPQAVRDYRDRMGLTMPVVVDDGRLADALNLRITPQHIVIGRDGRILYVGHLADAKLDHALQQAIAEPAVAQRAGDAPRISTTDHYTAPTLTTLSGAPLTLKGGRRKVIFFFSPWCETYLKSSRPAMADACLKARVDVSRISRASDTRWVGVAAGLWASPKDLSEYQRQHALPMPLALDQTGSFFRAFKISEVPTFVVLDSKGEVVARTASADDAERAARLPDSRKSSANGS